MKPPKIVFVLVVVREEDTSRPNSENEPPPRERPEVKPPSDPKARAIWERATEGK
jgi:hypothetical protein